MRLRYLVVPLTCAFTGNGGLAQFAETGGGYKLVSASRRAAKAGAEVEPRPSVVGSFGISSRYTGCPSCGVAGFVRCDRCGELSCHDDSAGDQFRCAVCGNQGRIVGVATTVTPATRI